MELVELTGTEKQITQANFIRSQHLARFEAAIAKAENLIVKHGLALEDGDLQLMIEIQVGNLTSALRLGGVDKNLESGKIVAVLRNALKWLSVQNSAKWWIDNDFSSDYLFTKFVKKYVKVQA